VSDELERLSSAAQELGQEVIDGLKDDLQDIYDNLTDEEKDVLKRAAKRKMRLKLDALRGEDVADDEAFVDATISEFQVAGNIAAATAVKLAFREGVKRVSETLGTFLAAFIRGWLRV
jgi:hypothetical protein